MKKVFPQTSAVTSDQVGGKGQTLYYFSSAFSLVNFWLCHLPHCGQTHVSGWGGTISYASTIQIQIRSCSKHQGTPSLSVLFGTEWRRFKKCYMQNALDKGVDQNKINTVVWYL